MEKDDPNFKRKKKNKVTRLPRRWYCKKNILFY